jgi:large subunit ribosomal protein L1
MELNDVLKELKAEKKRKFTQTVDLVVNLQNFDVRKEALNTFLNVPNPMEKKIGAFLTKKSKVVPTITEMDFDKYKELKDIKKLAKEYDFFIAVAPMMSKIATKFGRVFGPLGKMPSPQAGIIPQDSDDVVEKMVEKMKGVIRVRNKEMSIKVAVGKEDMDANKISENVEAVLKQLEAKLPRGRDCIKNVLLKFTMTKPIKFVDYTKKK